MHVVVLDLEVGHRLRPGLGRQLDVPVGLEGVGAAGGLGHPDQPGVHGSGAVAHRALEQQVAGGVGRHVVLEGAVVERLIAVPEVGGQEVAAGALPHQAAVGADPCVVAAEAGQAGGGGGLGLHHDLEASERPGGPIQHLHAEVADTGGSGHGDRRRGQRQTGPTAVEHLDHPHLAVGARSHDDVGRGDHAIGGTLVSDDDRLGDRHAGGHLDHDGIDGEGLVEPGEGVGRLGQGIEGVNRLATATHRGSTEAAVLDHGAGGAGREPIQVELVDAAVAPHLLRARRQGGRRERCRRLRAPVRQSLGTGQANDGFDGERAQDYLTALAQRGPLPAPGWTAMLPVAPLVVATPAYFLRRNIFLRRPLPDFSASMSARTWAPMELR